MQQVQTRTHSFAYHSTQTSPTNSYWSQCAWYLNQNRSQYPSALSFVHALRNSCAKSKPIHRSLWFQQSFFHSLTHWANLFVALPVSCWERVRRCQQQSFHCYEYLSEWFESTCSWFRERAIWIHPFRRHFLERIKAACAWELCIAQSNQNVWQTDS